MYIYMYTNSQIFTNTLLWFEILGALRSSKVHMTKNVLSWSASGGNIIPRICLIAI